MWPDFYVNEYIPIKIFSNKCFLEFVLSADTSIDSAAGNLFEIRSSALLQIASAVFIKEFSDSA